MLKICSAVATAALLTGAAAAADLTVETGAVTKVFSTEDLHSDFQNHEITTMTYWSDTEQTYRGPLLEDILKEVGIGTSQKFSVYALDGYSVLFDDPSIFAEHKPILATTVNNQPLEGGFAPYFIVSKFNGEDTMDDNLWVWAAKGIKLGE